MQNILPKFQSSENTASTLVYRDKTNGYTLIELLFVMVVMVILFSVGYANYRSYSIRKQVQSVADQIKSTLRYAQESALSGRLPTGCTNFAGYALEFDEVNGIYQVGAYCNGVLDTTSGFYKTTTVSLPISFDVKPYSGGSPEVLFKPLTGGASFPSGSSSTIRVGDNRQVSGGAICATQPWTAGCVITFGNQITIT